MVGMLRALGLITLVLSAMTPHVRALADDLRAAAEATDDAQIAEASDATEPESVPESPSMTQPDVWDGGGRRLVKSMSGHSVVTWLLGGVVDTGIQPAVKPSFVPTSHPDVPAYPALEHLPAHYAHAPPLCA